MSEPGARGTIPGAAEEDFEELWEDAPCGYLSTTPDGVILRANRTFLELSGYAAADLVGKRRFYDLLPPGAKIYYETHYAPLLQMQGMVREIALEIVCADGARRPVLVSATTKDDGNGRPLAVRVTVFDSSDRRRYERELLHARAEAESRAVAASALEHVSEGIVVLDEDGRVRLLNPAAERILGASADGALGLPLTALAPDWKAVGPLIPVGAPGEAAPVVVPLELDGGTRWLSVAAEAAPEGAVYTLRDVTEQRRLDELRDEIVAIVSHELRTPLAGVYGAAQTLLARGGQLGEEQRRALVETIGEQSGRLARIVEQILVTRRLGGGGLVPARGSFDLGEEVERIVGRAEEWRVSRPVVLELAEGVEVEGDGTLFEQVLVNLLDNAMKYGTPEGEVRVRVEAVRASGRVSVSDDGPGIPPGEQERIFEKFFRLDPDHASGAGGIGLGLYIARELVERMHGRIGLLPAERGATFFVDLPLSRAG